jgi:cytoskeletal protein RodZ
MSTFGEELRLQRLSRGIALEQITAVTKISQRHLIALEQDRFRQLPGGILSKGIVRGYAGAVGLDARDWTDRFLKASYAAGDPVDQDGRGWAEFASNVGKERMERREAMEQRLRWMGAIALVLVAVAVSYLSVRFYGVHAGWWDTLLPLHHAASKANAAVTHAATLLHR